MDNDLRVESRIRDRQMEMETQRLAIYFRGRRRRARELVQTNSPIALLYGPPLPPGSGESDACS